MNKKRKKRIRPKRNSKKINDNQKNNLNNKQTKTTDNIKPVKNKKKKAILIIFSIIISIILLFSTIGLIFINKIKIDLIGNKTETIEVYSEYQDPGYKSKYFNKQITKKSNLNTNILGTYEITYKLFSLKKNTRTINVVDTTPPSIELKGNKTINIYINDIYNDQGVTIKDNYDTNLENNLTIENNLNPSIVGTYTITYSVHDSSNNKSSITRTINVNKKTSSNFK